MFPGTLDRSAPPLFRRELSALSRLALYSALALFLMVADARWLVAEPVRQVVATLLSPLQWLMLQPVEWVHQGARYFQPLQQALSEADTARVQTAHMAVRAQQAEQLERENARLRDLLGLRARLPTSAQAAQVLHDSPDPYSRRVVIDRGLLAGVQLGAPVMDAAGILGQVTRVYPMRSEVTLLVERDQAIPVLNVRTGMRSVAYGSAAADGSAGVELPFMAVNADVQEGDLLTTSGVDGLYPPGLPVARVVRVLRRSNSAFARVDCMPLAQVGSAHHVMVLQPASAQPSDLPPQPDATEAVPMRAGQPADAGLP